MRLQRLSSPGVESSSCLRPLALLWFLLAATASSDAPPREEALTDEQRLLNVLRVNYDPAVRPVFDARQTVVIHLGITLTQIIDVDEKNQVLTTNVWLDQEWVDQKLKWNTSDFANITILRIPCDLIWLPDIVLYNSVENHNKGYMKSLAMVEHNGKVFWPPIVRMRSSCKMDITYFPFDDQICTLKLGSWAYDGLQVDVTNRTVNIDLSNYVDNGEWQLMDTRIVRNVKYYQCCPEPFPDVVFYLHIRRRILYYLLNVIIPCMLLSSLSLTGFLLPPDSGEKVTLGLTVLLAFSVFMLLVAENMPPTSEYVPLVGIYLTVIMAMSALSVALSVFVLNCHHRGAMLHRPHPIVRLVALAIARMMCMSLRYLNKGPYRRCASNNLTSPCGRQPSSIFGHTTSSSYLENGLHELNSPTDNEEEGNDQHHQHHQHQQQQHVIHQHYQHQNHHNHNNQSCLSQHNNIQQHRQHVIDLGLNGLVGDWSRPADGTAPSTANSQHTGNGGGVGDTPQACAGRTEREILLYLRAVLEAHERGKLERVAVCEWQEVARVMDKLFFWIFVIVTSVSTVVLLVISPMTKNVNVHEQ